MGGKHAGLPPRAESWAKDVVGLSAPSANTSASWSRGASGRFERGLWQSVAAVLLSRADVMDGTHNLDDLTQGRDLTDEALLEALRVRHAAKRVYTYAGCVHARPITSAGSSRAPMFARGRRTHVRMGCA